jgi:hypothetical protein
LYLSDQVAELGNFFGAFDRGILKGKFIVRNHEVRIGQTPSCLVKVKAFHESVYYFGDAEAISWDGQCWRKDDTCRRNWVYESNFRGDILTEFGSLLSL